MGNLKAVWEAKQMEAELTRLFGETSYRVKKRACRGQYQGHNDYSLIFGSGSRSADATRCARPRVGGNSSNLTGGVSILTSVCLHI